MYVANTAFHQIIQIPVKEGDIVRRGDLLLRIDPSQYEAGVSRSQAALSSADASVMQSAANRDQAKRALDRSKELRRTNEQLVSNEQLEQAQTAFDVANALATSAEHQVEQARASLKEAQDALSKTVIRAPMDGQVTRVAVEAGEVAVPGTFSKETGLLMTVSDLSVILVKVRVDETDVVRHHLVQRIIRAYDEHKVKLAEEQMELLDSKAPPNGNGSASQLAQEAQDKD